MKYRLSFAKYAVCCLSLCGILIAVPPANGSEFYTYQPDEYVTVTNGVSPNRRFSVAAHGNGEN